MFSRQNGDSEPRSTSSLWGDVMGGIGGGLGGIGGMMKLLADPTLHQHAHQMILAIINSQVTNQRIEYKFDLILRGMGHDVEAINAEFERSRAHGAAAALPQIGTGARAGGPSAASASAHTGTR